MMGPMMTLHNPRGTLSAHTALLINTCLKARSAFPAKPYAPREKLSPCPFAHSTQSPGRRRFLAQSTAGSRQIPGQAGNSRICTLCRIRLCSGVRNLMFAAAFAACGSDKEKSREEASCGGYLAAASLLPRATAGMCEKNDCVAFVCRRVFIVVRCIVISIM